MNTLIVVPLVLLVIGAASLFVQWELYTGKFPYTMRKVIVAWFVTMTSLTIILLGTFFGMMKAGAVFLIPAVFFNMASFAIAWSTVVGKNKNK